MNEGSHAGIIDQIRAHLEMRRPEKSGRGLNNEPVSGSPRYDREPDREPDTWGAHGMEFFHVSIPSLYKRGVTVEVGTCAFCWGLALQM